MRVLIVEDDFVSRQLLNKILSHYGYCDIAVNGKEAVEAFRMACEEGQPYDLICLDIMMPEMNGHDTLKAIRELEKELLSTSSEKAKVIVTSALADKKNVSEAIQEGCQSYLLKPIKKQKLMEELRSLGLID